MVQDTDITIQELQQFVHACTCTFESLHILLYKEYTTFRSRAANKSLACGSYNVSSNEENCKYRNTTLPL